MYQCEICGKKLKSRQGLSGHYQFAHGRHDYQQQRITTKFKTNTPREYPFGNSELDSLAKPAILAGMAKSKSDFHSKIAHLFQLMLHEDPKFFEEFIDENLRLSTREEWSKFYWFMKQVGFVNSPEDYRKKELALTSIRKMCPF